jgi:REP element-mobilizing transposase RayT
MEMSEIGKIAEEEWSKTKTLRSNIDLDYYVIMPNHLRGIVVLNAVETRRGEPLHNKSTSQFGKPVRNSLSIIINQYKGSVKRWANRNNYLEFSWQTRFYDHIIRNEKELYRIRKYIEQNPLKWEIDKDKTENIYL